MLGPESLETPGQVWESSGSCRLFLHFLGKSQFKKCLGKHLEVPDILLPDIRGLLKHGPNRPFWTFFGQNDLIPNWILAFAGPKWTILVHFGLKRSILVHLGPLTVLRPFLKCAANLAKDSSHHVMLKVFVLKAQGRHVM